MSDSSGDSGDALLYCFGCGLSNKAEPSVVVRRPDEVPKIKNLKANVVAVLCNDCAQEPGVTKPNVTLAEIVGLTRQYMSQEQQHRLEKEREHKQYLQHWTERVTQRIADKLCQLAVSAAAAGQTCTSWEYAVPATEPPRGGQELEVIAALKERFKDFESVVAFCVPNQDFLTRFGALITPEHTFAQAGYEWHAFRGFRVGLSWRNAI